jgi:hypothetical protein
VSKLRIGLMAALGAAAALATAGTASAIPIKMPTAWVRLAQQKRAASSYGVTPPAPPCPENAVYGGCVAVPETSEIVPTPTNMAYYGGAVPVHPRVYLVLWGWDDTGAFPGRSCTSSTFTEGSITTSLSCDPDGAGRYMADLLQQVGGTQWAGVSTQFYETDAAGNRTYISNDPDILAGIWVDDGDPAAGDNPNLTGTTGSNPPGSTNTETLLALEAQRAAAHFGVSGSGLHDAQFVIAQPPAFSDPDAANQGYCAFHDYTLPGVFGGIYDGITPGIAYTDMPYQLLPSLAVGCGQDSVNSGQAGNLDGFSETLGHEVEETITDPGAEDVLDNASGGQTFYGGWYDVADVDETGDKCAAVGYNPTGVGPTLVPIPGALGDIQGNAGETFAMQSLWSNAAAGGSGWCAGVASTDLPGPLAGEPPYN